MEPLFDCTIYGELASKSNSRRIVRSKKNKKTKKQRYISIKSEKAMDFSDLFHQQKKEFQLEDLIEGDITIYVDVWYKSRRPDLDVELIKDLLQNVAYKNDRQIKEQHSKWHLDKENPRCRVRIFKCDLNKPIL